MPSSSRETTPSGDGGGGGSERGGGVGGGDAAAAAAVAAAVPLAASFSCLGLPRIVSVRPRGSSPVPPPAGNAHEAKNGPPAAVDVPAPGEGSRRGAARGGGGGGA